MKLSRNDPCWCGSGKKYKHCHLESEARVRAVDLSRVGVLTDAMRRVFETTAVEVEDFDERVEAPARQARTAFCDRIGIGLRDEQAAIALETYLGELERAMKEIAGRYERSWLLHTTRRLPPSDGQTSAWTMQLRRRILTLAGLKYGAGSGDAGVFVETDAGEAGVRLVPPVPSVPEVIDLHSLDDLAAEYAHAAAAYRRVGKGAVLQVREEGFQAVADPELEGLIQLVDDRHERYGELTGPAGAAVNLEAPPPPDDPHGVAFATVINGGAEPSTPLRERYGVRFDGPSNFIPTGLPLGPVRAVLQGFGAEIEQAYGVSLDDLLGVLFGLSGYALYGLKEQPAGAAAQLFLTGYAVASTRTDLLADLGIYLREWLRRCGGPTLSEEEARARAERAAACLTYSEDDYGEISLWDRTPYKLLIEDRGRTFVDYAAMPEAVYGLLHAVGFLDGDPANVKAANFEDEVVRRAAAEGFEPWKARAILRTSDGAEREIDAGFLVADTLFVVECKAFAQNPRIDRGDFAALKGRRETLQRHLGQAVSLAQLLRRNRSGANYAVPASAVEFEPLVCTPGGEFIWSRDEGLWLDERHPRIVYPDELVEILRSVAQIGS